MYTAHAAIELHAEAFEQAGKLDQLEAFASFHGPDFYRLPRNRERVILEKRPWHVPAEFTLGDATCVPMRAGESVAWSLQEPETAAGAGPTQAIRPSASKDWFAS